jgi:hypothetical protein
MYVHRVDERADTDLSRSARTHDDDGCFYLSCLADARTSTGRRGADSTVSRGHCGAHSDAGSAERDAGKTKGPHRVLGHVPLEAQVGVSLQWVACYDYWGK